MSDSVENNEEEYILVWDAPKIEAPEFRLYYKEDGTIDFYTCEKPEGDHIVIDSLTFAEARPDIKVIDGRISKIRPCATVQKYKPSTSGVSTSAFDISVIIDPVTKKDKVQYWKLCDYEIK